MSFGTYISSIYTLLGLLGLAGVGAFAWWKGGRPERLGTLVLVVTWIGADLARGVGGQMVPAITLLVSDALISGAFLYIAIRYSSLWLGAAMIFQAIGFAMHAAQLSDSDAPRWHGWIVYLLINNVLSYMVLLSLAGGTVVTILRRRRQAREKAAAQVKAAARAGRLTAQPPPPEAAT